MRIFLASDIHGARKALPVLTGRKREQGADVVVLAGDVTHRGRPRRFLEDAIEAFGPTPVIAIPGNLDPPHVHARFAAAGARALHGRRLEVAGQWFAGFGGATPHILGGPFQVTEDEIEAGLASAQPGDVLVVHCPPRGTLDRVFFGIRAGSRAVLRAVQRIRPPLVVSGHVHEARGIVRRDGTVFVNAGPGKRLRSALIELGADGVEVELSD